MFARKIHHRESQSLSVARHDRHIVTPIRCQQDVLDYLRRMVQHPYTSVLEWDSLNSMPDIWVESQDSH